MSNEAFNKIYQTHDLFKKVTANLKKLLGISFGYMKVFNDGSYYAIMDDLECLTKFVTNVKKSSIFCERNVTNCFDGNYNYTLWPQFPKGSAMEVYYDHNIWNGITVSKIDNNFTEIYWFTGDATVTNLHKFFIRNKPLLFKFIKYFESFKEILCIPETHQQQGLFKFSQGFDHNLSKSIYIEEELPIVNKLIMSLEINSMVVNKLQTKNNLSPRETEVLAIICRGYTTKIIAQKLGISTKTVQYYIEHIKQKTGLHFKSDLIKFYEEYFIKHN